MKSRTEGSVVVLVLWLLLFVSLITAAVGFNVRLRLRQVGQLETREKLRNLADAGVEKARYMLAFREDQKAKPDLLNGPWSASPPDFRGISIGPGIFSVEYPAEKRPKEWKDPEDMRYGLCDEERKIHLNRTDSVLILTRLFQYGAALAVEEARTLARSILDWRDEDDDPSEGGAESRYYRAARTPYLPKNRDFDVLEELLYVRGMTPEILERVRPYLTLTSNGKINLNTAPFVVLAAQGMPETLIDKVLATRRGRDAKDATEDDVAFSNLESVPDQVDSYAALSDEERARLTDFMQSGAFDVRSETFAVRSVARLTRGRQVLTVSAVMRENGEILQWQERFS